MDAQVFVAAPWCWVAPALCCSALLACGSGASSAAIPTQQQATAEPAVPVVSVEPPVAPAPPATAQAGDARSPEIEAADEADTSPESAFWAEPAAPSPSPARSAAPRRGQPAKLPAKQSTALDLARREFRAGAAAYRRGDYAAARARFLEAHQLKPNPRLLYDIAMAELQLRNRASACRRYRQFVAAVGASSSAATSSAKLAQSCGVP